MSRLSQPGLTLCPLTWFSQFTQGKPSLEHLARSNSEAHRTLSGAGTEETQRVPRGPSPGQGLTEATEELGLEPSWAPPVICLWHSVGAPNIPAGPLRQQAPGAACRWGRVGVQQAAQAWVGGSGRRGPGGTLSWLPYVLPLCMRLPNTRLPESLPRQREASLKSVCTLPFQEAQERRPYALVKNKGRSCAQEPQGPLPPSLG